MIEVQFFIPIRDNTGGLFPPAHHTSFLRRVLSRFDGATFLPGETDGVWRSPVGRVDADRCRVLLIAVASLTASGAKLRAVARAAAVHYRQDAILFRYLGVSEIV